MPSAMAQTLRTSPQAPSAQAVSPIPSPVRPAAGSAYMPRSSPFLRPQGAIAHTPQIKNGGGSRSLFPNRPSMVSPSFPIAKNKIKTIKQETPIARRGEEKDRERKAERRESKNQDLLVGDIIRFPSTEPLCDRTAHPNRRTPHPNPRLH